MIVLHHLDHSRSQRVLWLLEELGLEYQIEYYTRDPETSLAPLELQEVHPLGKSPVITDGDATVAESGAIIEYLVDTYGDGALKPQAGTEDARRYTYWLHYAEGSLMPFLLLRLIFTRVENAPVPFFIKPVVKRISAQVNTTFIQPNLDRHIDFLEREMQRSTFLAGEELSGADIQMFFPIKAILARASEGKSLPKMRAYLERLETRPAYQQALQRGGSFKIL